MEHHDGCIDIEVTDEGCFETDICGPIKASYTRDHEAMTTEAKANAERIIALWNAADGMTTEQARRSIEFGKVLLEIGMFPDSIEVYQRLLTKLESK